MPLRHRHRVGRYLMVDDESGIVAYDDQILKRWDGAFVRRKGWETRHPQEFVRARNDPKALKNVRPPQDDLGCVEANPPYFVGNTRIRSPRGIGYRLNHLAIGRMEIGCTFQIEEGFTGPPPPLVVPPPPELPPDQPPPPELGLGFPVYGTLPVLGALADTVQLAYVPPLNIDALLDDESEDITDDSGTAIKVVEP